jgi:hypothetical protein
MSWCQDAALRRAVAKKTSWLSLVDVVEATLVSEQKLIYNCGQVAIVLAYCGCGGSFSWLVQ